jgi:hypothetical protein
MDESGVLPYWYLDVIPPWITSGGGGWTVGPLVAEVQKRSLDMNSMNKPEGSDLTKP